ncbi:hypothetical protein PAAG_11870 [Paracoccidioides lutzii Pb01]|uniref:Uncharacterized protein n=1 Tax=Paracoccidioides lutzii (strain ATCC MYA-826 / Pb01) TaxID=502779 RepID=A0A0A2V0R3_PARBA|nr:hypothetical protein PAAG_11870 [Paracoccidioides lutzii Pb01]KGQ01406.1 hypothetical protein PAAG_11870 [Paracoccidioides lutzii Pb01]
MDDTWDIPENGQTDVDEQVGATSAFEKDPERRQEDGKDDFADVSGLGLVYDDGNYIDFLFEEWVLGEEEELFNDQSIDSGKWLGEYEEEGRGEKAGKDK